jgi:hypothetical protein
MNIIPESMKLMSYDQGETVYYKNLQLGEHNAFSLVLLYSDRLTPTSNRFMFYVIEDPSTRIIKTFNYTINLIGAKNPVINGIIRTDRLVMNNSFIGLNAGQLKMFNINDINDYVQLSSLMDFYTMNAINCSFNHDSFGIVSNKKPIIKFDYQVGYGEDPSSITYIQGSIIIGDYDSLSQAYNTLDLGTAPSNIDFIRGVVSYCAKQ